MLDTQEKKPRLLRVSTNDSQVIVLRQFLRKTCPRSSQVSRSPQVGLVVVLTVVVNDDIRHIGVVWRSFDAADRAPFWQAKQVLRNIRPTLACIAADMNESVVGAGPKNPGLDRRFRQGENRAVKLRSGVVPVDGATRIFLFRLRLIL